MCQLSIVQQYTFWVEKIDYPNQIDLCQLFKSSTSEKEGMFWPKLPGTLKEKNWAKVKTDEDSMGHGLSYVLSKASYKL